MYPSTLRLVLLLYACCLAAPRRADGQAAEGGARAVALAGAVTAVAGDAWGHANPAAWATLPGRAVALFASEGYGMDELRLGAVRYAEPLAFGTVVAGARVFGFDAYRETSFEAGFARGMGLGSARRLYAGLRVRYERVRVAGYGGAGAVGLSVGGLVEVAYGVRFGFAAANVNAPRWTRGDELPRTLALGVSVDAAPGVLVALDVMKDVRFPASVRAGLEAQPVRALALRAGVATAPVRFAAGAGLRLAHLSVDIAADRHEVLGWTPAVSLALLW